MSFTQSNLSQPSQEEFFRNPRLALLRALQGQGINTDYNYLARRQLDRANDLVPLAYAYGADQGSFPNFAEQYANAMFRGGNQGMFSNQDIRSRVNQLIQGGGGAQGSDAYEWMREGDPSEQYQRFSTLQNLGRRGELPGFSQARGNVENRAFENWWQKMAADPTGGAAGGATTFIDAFLGRATPPPSTSGAYASPANPTPGGYAPPAQANAPGSTPAGSAPAIPGQSPAASGNQFANWQAVLNYLMQGHDVRNLQTAGMVHPGRAFSFGGVTYDPNAQQGGQRIGGTGRFSGGAGWTGFVYRMNNLRARRDQIRQALAAGKQVPPELMGEATKTDDQLARDAVQWVNSNWQGNTGLTLQAPVVPSSSYIPE
jgi:hypothetical protein